MHDELIKRIRAKLSLPKNHSTLVKKAQLISYISHLNLQNKAMLYHLHKQQADATININKLHEKQRQLEEIQHLLLTYELQCARKKKDNIMLKNKINFIQEYIHKCRLEIETLSQESRAEKNVKKQKVVQDISDINQNSIINDGEHAIVELMKGFKNFMKSDINQEDLMLSSKIQNQYKTPTFHMGSSQSNLFLNNGQKLQKNHRNSIQNSSQVDETEEVQQSYNEDKVQKQQEDSLYNEGYYQQSVQSQNNQVLKKVKSQIQIDNGQKKLDIMSIFGAFGKNQNKV